MKPNRLAVFLVLALCFVMIGLSGCTRITIKPPTAKTCNVAPFADQSEVVHTLNVARLRPMIEVDGENIASDNAPKISMVANLLDQATEIAQEGEGNDVACKVRLTMSPQTMLNPDQAVREFNSNQSECLRKGKICEETDFNEVINQASNMNMKPNAIILVEEIGWCGQTEVDTYWGCTLRGYTIIESACQEGLCPKSESVLWLHEFGHLKDRPDLASNSPKPYVMSGVIDAQNTHLTKCDCFDLRDKRSQ